MATQIGQTSNNTKVKRATTAVGTLLENRLLQRALNVVAATTRSIFFVICWLASALGLLRFMPIFLNASGHESRQRKLFRSKLH